jgi:hypothetical protein
LGGDGEHGDDDSQRTDEIAGQQGDDVCNGGAKDLAVD